LPLRFNNDTFKVCSIGWRIHRCWQCRERKLQHANRLEIEQFRSDQTKQRTICSGWIHELADDLPVVADDLA